MACFRQSKRRATQFLGTILNQPASTAWMVLLQNRCAEAVEPVYDQLARQLPDQAILHIDESPTKQGSAKAWVWTAVAKTFTVFACRTSRGADVLEDLLGPAYPGVIHCDFVERMLTAIEIGRRVGRNVFEWLAEAVRLKKARVSAIFDGCGFIVPADLSAEKLERFLDALRTGEKKLSVQTANDYLQAVSQFCNLMVENDRLERNPFDKVKKGNADRDRHHVRRVLDADELQHLCITTKTSNNTRRGPTGEDRAMLYTVAA